MDGFINGVDISSMDEIVKLGAKFYDNGVEKALPEILSSYGVNYVRLRLWMEPYSEEGKSYGAGCNDLNATIRIAKEIKQSGFRYLLDFQYSDFWVDPGKQMKPKKWRNYNRNELETAVYEYTRDTLLLLKKQQCSPDMVQVGNEITNGLLWPEGQVPEYGWMTRFINAGIRAVREVHRDIPVMLHLDQGNNKSLYREWLNHYFRCGGEDFDVIGLSYYPVWDGPLDGLIANMDMLAESYGKPMIVAEVSCPFTTEDYASREGLLPEQRKGAAARADLLKDMEYPVSVEGQQKFMEDFLKKISQVKKHLCIGYFYWEPAWIPVKGSGWATPEGLEYISDPGPGGNEWANQALFDYDGNPLPALTTIREFVSADM